MYKPARMKKGPREDDREEVGSSKEKREGARGGKKKAEPSARLR